MKNNTEKVERNRDIIKMFSEGRKLREIGIIFGISHERVRQIANPKAKLAAKLRNLRTITKIPDDWVGIKEAEKIDLFISALVPRD